MAMLISRATGNFTAAATWGVADSATGSQLTNPSASTNTTTSYVYSSTFTGTNTRVADGIALFLKRLNTTGTVTVALSDDNGVTATREVTVNASDLPADESWVFFKFGTTLTLDGGTDYRVGVKASSADNALIYRNATAGNWARMVSTTTTSAPAATDTMLIVGEWTGAGASSSYTVTMDNTATTDFGTNTSSGLPSQTNAQTFNGIQIGQNGTLTWGTSSATSYYLKVSGHVVVWSGGTYNMGTSGTPCPRDSTMTLQFDSTGDSTTTAYGFRSNAGATSNIYGQSRSAGKNIVNCLLTSNASANATSLTVSADTGWLDNDEVVIAATSTARTECEAGTLNGNAGASTLTVDGFAGTAGGLAFAHSGTSPTQAEIINLTRNVTIRGVSTSSTSWVQAANGATVNFNWCSFYWCGSITAGFFILINNLGSASLSYCSFYNGMGSNIFRNGTFSNNVMFQPSNSNTGFSFDTGTPTISNNVFIRPGGDGFSFGGANINSATVTNNTIVGSNASPLSISATNLTADMTISDLTVHSAGSSGISISASAKGKKIILSNLQSWRNIGYGINVSAARVEIDNAKIFASTLGGIFFQSSAPSLKVTNSRISSDATVTMPVGLLISSNSIQGSAVFENCKFSEITGVYTANTVDINITNDATIFTRPTITLNNTLLGAATEVSNPANLDVTGFIKSSKHDQTEGAFKSWFQGGVIERDTTIFNTAAPSERLTPSSATIKLASGPRLVAVDDGNTITINAYVRKSTAGDGAAYNGNQPRLIVKANPACGINSDTVLDTMTVGTGTWEQLTGTTAAVDADGALEFVVDCDGTAGWINIDDWTVA
jgi:hypothetical protein